MSKSTLWIIENLTKEESYLELDACARKLGYVVLSLRGDFVKKDFIEQVGQKVRPVIVCAGIGMNSVITGALPKWANRPYCTVHNYLCSQYYPKLDKYLFNDRYIMLPSRMAKEKMWMLYENFGEEAKMFIRPDSGEKPFKAGLVDVEEFTQFIDGYTSPNELLLFSTPKNSVGEWRIVVSPDIGVIAMSSYRYQGLLTRVPSAPKGATDLALKVLNIYVPDKVFCVDVVQDGDGKFWVMEITSFSSAGLYACNKEAVITAVSEIAANEQNRQS